MIECPLKRSQPEGALCQQIPVKRFDMPHVKNNPVSLGDRPVVKSLFANHAEYLVGTCASAKQSQVKVVSDANSCGESSHGRCFPSLGCNFHAKDAPKFGVGRLGALRWSLRGLWLSIEMNTKPALF